MPNLKEIRNRIGSVKNTRKITSAMKLVAAAKLKRATDAVQAARPYATKMTEVIDELVTRVDVEAHPLLREVESESNILIILVTSDRGLCGGFNNNLLRGLKRFTDDKAQVTDSIQMITIGRKGNVFFKNDPNVEIIEDVEGIIGDITFPAVKEVARKAMSMFTGEEVDRVYLVFNEFISAITINQIVRPILPLNTLDTSEEPGTEIAVRDDDAGEDVLEYIYEPSEEALLGQLLPNSIEIQLFQALLESAASEQGSRMTAMDNATSNASDMIDRLTLQYNRARQAYITKELVEIVSGAEALNG